jgi:hypothetical protein
MRCANWASLLIVPFSVMACAAQGAERERHVKELETRVRQLSTQCERLEERLLAVEVLERHRANASPSASTGVSGSPPSNIGARPDLPTVKAGPGSPNPAAAGEPERTADASADESNRLTIVGEGNRVEARVGSDIHLPAPTNASSKSNSRAAKRNPTTVAGTPSSGANP